MATYVSGTRPSPLPNADRRELDDRWSWWETPHGQWRLRAEAEAMRRFPEFHALGREDGFLAWVGWLKSSLHHENAYLVSVVYPRGFPDEAPEVVIHGPAIPSGTPHLLSGNRPCLYMPSEGPRHGYDPARTTAATLVAWTALWIHAFETWQDTCEWPGEEA